MVHFPLTHCRIFFLFCFVLFDQHYLSAPTPTPTPHHCLLIVRFVPSQPIFALLRAMQLGTITRRAVDHIQTGSTMRKTIKRTPGPTLWWDKGVIRAQGFTLMVCQDSRLLNRKAWLLASLTFPKPAAYTITDQSSQPQNLSLYGIKPKRKQVSLS